MAFQTAVFSSGKAGNLIYFNRNGKSLARSIPMMVKQSAATKVRSVNFGISSACTRSLRQQLTAVLADGKNRTMQLKFTGAVAKWLGTTTIASLPAMHPVPFVTDFQFNPVTCIAERWKLAIKVEQLDTNMLGVHIPAFKPLQCITAPAHTISITCTITVAGCLLNNAALTGNHTVIIEIPYNNLMIPPQVISFPVGMPAGSLVVTAMSLQYKLTSNNYYCMPAFLPASVVDARYC